MTYPLSATGSSWRSARGTTRASRRVLDLRTAYGDSASASSSQEGERSTAPSAQVPGTAQSPGRLARAALDSQAAAAAQAGTRVVYDSEQPGRLVDMSAMDPEQLAAIANGTGATFSDDEAVWAQVELSGRVRKTLEGLDTGDPDDSRAYQTGVKALYAQMSPAVRQALGWTPHVLEAADRLIEHGESRHGPLDPQRFWGQFIEGQRKRGALRPSRVDLTS